MERVIPLDSAAVLQYGIERWLDDCFWPVPEREFVALCARVEACIAQRITSGTPLVADALLVNRSLAVEYWHFLHAVIVLDRLRRDGVTPLVSEHTPWYRMLVDGSCTAFPNGALGSMLASPARARLPHRAMVTRPVRAALLNIVGRKAPMFFRSRGVIASLGVPPPYVQSYAAQLPHRIAITGWNDWMRTVVPLAEHERVRMRTDAWSIANDLATIAATYGSALTAPHRQYLAICTERHLTDAATALRSIRCTLRGNDVYAFSMPGNAHQRALAIAARAAGVRVVSFAHSGSLALFDSYTMSVNEFALSDDFVTLTPGSVSGFTRILAAHTPLRGNTVHIVPGVCTEYATIRAHAQRTPLPAHVTRVMVIGFPHGPWRKPQGAGLFWWTMLDFELRLIRALQQFGYDVTYKAHPDRMGEAAALFGNRVRICGGDIRDAFNAADAFVASSVRTTAFHLACCTRKPVVGFLVEPDTYPMFSDVRERLARRCTLLTARYDANDRLVLDGTALRAALARAPEEPDATFYDMHLAPTVCVPASSS